MPWTPAGGDPLAKTRPRQRCACAPARGQCPADAPPRATLPAARRLCPGMRRPRPNGPARA
eukprot:9490586-Pyramimonas_sp.AAC.1